MAAHIHRRPNSMRTIAVLLVCGWIAGCGSEPEYKGDKRFPVSGTVSFNGEPVDGGMISFVPETEGGNPCGGPIQNGKFDFPEPQGPNKGSYRIQVVWRKPTGKKIEDSDTGETIDEVEQVIPAEFNTATTQTAVVTDDPMKNVYTFDLKSK